MFHQAGSLWLHLGGGRRERTLTGSSSCLRRGRPPPWWGLLPPSLPRDTSSAPSWQRLQGQLGRAQHDTLKLLTSPREKPTSGPRGPTLGIPRGNGAAPACGRTSTAARHKVATLGARTPQPGAPPHGQHPGGRLTRQGPKSHFCTHARAPFSKGSPAQWLQHASPPKKEGCVP